MYFSVHGRASPCWKLLGYCDDWSQDRSIRDIWFGDAFEKYRKALEGTLQRMQSGRNRSSQNTAGDRALDYINNSVGAIMFLNTRSAVLQTLSSINFINWSFNNPYQAGKAFANQKQYWKDFMTLMNSPYLVERRNGLKINVSESEIADAVAESKNKPKAALAYLLSKGFVMTRFADSFAIASGGSTFYRNTVDALVKSGMDQKSAEKKAFDDFRALAEESQQSSNPSRISQQQASAAGRVILAFANTPMQYARIIKKSSQDLINGRGDWKSNVAKIAYYGAMQNVVFNALQQALFALAFSDDEEEKEKQKKDKTGRIVNGMVDSLIKGAGIQGQAIIALKNAIVKIAEEADKNSPEFQKAVDDLLGFSPPLSAKIRKIKGGLKAFSWSRKEMKEKGFDLNNPAYLASAQVISGLTNIPVDRAVKKLNNIRAIFSDSSAKWQKVAMALVELIYRKYPKDSIDIIVFGNEAWPIKVKDLPYLKVGPYHTNTVAGLELAMDILRRKRNTNKQIFMITDGKPSCIKLPSGEIYKNSNGLDDMIVSKCLNKAAQARKLKIPITTFMIAQDPYLRQFVELFTAQNQGKAFLTGLSGLGEMIFEDYEKNRIKKI